MNAVAWLALAAAVLLVPRPAPAARRVSALAQRGRLVAATAPVRSLPASPPRWAVPAATGVGCAAAVGAVVLVGGLTLGLACAVFTLTLTGLAFSAVGRRREAQRGRVLLAAVRLMVAELEAGSPPHAALRAAAALVPEHATALVAAAGAAGSGGDIAAALRSGGAAKLEPLAHAWRVGTLAGAPMAEVLGRVAADLADHADQRRVVAVALAGARSSSGLLAVLPVVGVALGSALGARPVQFLLGTRGGRSLLLVGVALDAAGVLWTHRLMRRAERE
jgi:tight adherence protein B